MNKTLSLLFISTYAGDGLKSLPCESKIRAKFEARSQDRV